jgi:hypothetical protein
MIKAVMLFLIVMLVIGIVGNALFPGAMTRKLSRKRPGTCPRCGRFIIGSRGCDCKKG